MRITFTPFNPRTGPSACSTLPSTTSRLFQHSTRNLQLPTTTLEMEAAAVLLHPLVTAVAFAQQQIFRKTHLRGHKALRPRIHPLFQSLLSLPLLCQLPIMEITCRQMVQLHKRFPAAP